MSPIILYMTWHPVAFVVRVLIVFAPIVWVLTATGGALS